MICTLTIVRYPRWLGWAGLLSMAVFRLPLSVGKDKGFFKLMGCGKNGIFSKVPDWRQWTVLHMRSSTPVFISAWWRFFHCKIWQLKLEPIPDAGTCGSCNGYKEREMVQRRFIRSFPHTFVYRRLASPLLKRML